jgi:hypothetical protein
MAYSRRNGRGPAPTHLTEPSGHMFGTMYSTALSSSCVTWLSGAAAVSRSSSPSANHSAIGSPGCCLQITHRTALLGDGVPTCRHGTARHSTAQHRPARQRIAQQHASQSCTASADRLGPCSSAVRHHKRWRTCARQCSCWQLLHQLRPACTSAAGHHEHHAAVFGGWPQAPGTDMRTADA